VVCAFETLLGFLHARYTFLWSSPALALHVLQPLHAVTRCFVVPFGSANWSRAALIVRRWVDSALICVPGLSLRLEWCRPISKAYRQLHHRRVLVSWPVVVIRVSTLSSCTTMHATALQHTARGQHATGCTRTRVRATVPARVAHCAGECRGGSGHLAAASP
jgi:hypothetical protein